MKKHNSLTNEIIDERIVQQKRKHLLKRKQDVIDCRTPIDWECLNCDFIWKCSPNNISNGFGNCPVCGPKSKVTSNDIIDKKLIFKNIPIERIEDIKDSTTPIKWKCKKIVNGVECGFVWKTNSNNILKKNNPTGCPKCSGLSKLTNEEVDKRLENRNIKRLDDMINCISYIDWKCLISGCNTVWKQTPNSILNCESGCPKCADVQKLTDEEIDRRLIEMCRFLKRKGTVINAHTKIRWECLVDTCKNIWEATPTNILDNNRGCPRCKLSKGNLELNRTCELLCLKSIGEFKFKDCIDQKELPFDRYLPDYNCCIEFHGEQHYNKRYWKLFGHSDEYCEIKFQDRIKKDSIKRDYCEKNGILLIEIPYWDLKNIEKIIREKLNIC